MLRVANSDGGDFPLLSSQIFDPAPTVPPLVDFSVPLSFLFL